MAEGRFLKAKTLLLAGMQGMPESRAVAAAWLTPAERTEYRSRFEAFVAPGRRGVDMLCVFLEFHRLGVSQVVRIDRPDFHLG